MKTNVFAKTMVVFGLLALISTTSYGQRNQKDNNRMKLNPEEIFEERDKNEDGKLEKSELIGFISNDFDKVDTDADGFLSLEEFKEAPKFKRREQKQRRGGERRERPSTDQVFAKLDANKDDKLSKEEAKGPLSRHFDKLDTNDDGYISKEELEKAPKPERGNNTRRRH